MRRARCCRRGARDVRAAQPQAQPWPPGPGTPPAAGQNYAAQVCQRLEGQLAAIDRGASGDPARAEQVRRYEEASSRQQGELDRMVEQSRRQGCESTGFFLFGGGNASSQQCVDLTRQIARMRGNLDRINVDLQRLRGGDSDRGEQRRSVMLALAQNNCGPQYRTAARAPGGFFDQLFGARRQRAVRRSRQSAGAGRDRPHHLRAHLRRILFPDLLRDQRVALPRGREDLPADVPGQPK